MNEDVKMSELRKDLGIDDWLELVKEDKNLNGAYISFGQYMYILEQELTKYKERCEKAIELLKQPVPNYASAIKLLDELEEILKKEKTIH